MQHSAVYREKSVDVVIIQCGSRCGGAFDEMHRYDWLKYRTVLFFKSRRVGSEAM